MPALLELKGIRKQFLGVDALKDVDFDLHSGEIHALMGENGAGKSTLIKVLSGAYQLDSGSMSFEGKLIYPRSPDEATRLGISTVYQEINLAPNLSVMENLVIGRAPKGALGIRWRETKKRAENAISRLGLEIDVRAPLASLSIALQQMVAIARALDVSCRVLVLDEPTSSLDASEVAALFQVLRQLRSEGLGIIFITHFLEQVYEISDRITILRNGGKVGTWPTPELPRLQLVTHMIGRDAADLERPPTIRAIASDGAQLLSAERLGRRGSVNDITFELRPGETLGLAGLLGSGRTETLRLLYGIDQPDFGQLCIDGGTPHHFSPRGAIVKGIGYLSEDRKRDGLFPDLTVRENILAVRQVKKGWWRRIPDAQQKACARDLADQLRVQPADLERPVQFLSGGNQQKALLARWLVVKPRVLLLDEPTRGIDVGAKFEIMSLVERLRQGGRSFVFVSSELPEVVRSCTKVLVMRDRHPVGMLENDAISEDAIVGEIAGS